MIGELEKRIKKLAEDQRKHWMDISDAIPPEDILVVVDEMFKEFPCYPICTWSNGDSTKVRDKNGDIIYLPCEAPCYAWRDWFKKWSNQK